GGAAQQHAGIVAEKTAKRDKRPIGSNLAQGVGRRDRIVADVINLVLTCNGGIIRCPQDHVGGGPAGRRRGWSQRRKEATNAAANKIPDDQARVVDAEGFGDALGGEGIIESDVEAPAVEESVLNSP